jgi:predicted transcriptional regulator
MTTASNHLDLTTSVVAAYVENNAIAASELPALIKSVHAALGSLGAEAPEPDSVAKPTPSEIRRSVRPDALVSFEDGKSYKTLKRHLNTVGLTPGAYRTKWGLPGDYPMTAPNYSAARSALAKAAGLGRKIAAPTKATTVKAAAVTAAVAKPRLKGKLGLFRKG